jgi:hypothetical protein
MHLYATQPDVGPAKASAGFGYSVYASEVA